MWNILLSDEEAMIADHVRSFLSAELPLERLRPKAAAVDAAAIHRSMADLGWFSIGLPESSGGSGLGLVEEMLIQRELGRYVASPSCLAATLAGHIAAAADDIDLVREITSGLSGVGLAMIRLDARGNAPAWIFDWAFGDRIVAWNDEGIGLFPAEALTQAQVHDCTDDSLRMHGGNLDLTKALHWIGREQSDLLQRLRILIAAALVGLADHACDLTIDYAKLREQFGKPIGSFQAVKHRAADMGVRTRLAWYQTNVACLKLMAGADDASLQIDSALLLANEAAHENARASIQLHGAIGFQAECDVHWFMKRAHVYEQLVGGRFVVAQQVLAHPTAT